MPASSLKKKKSGPHRTPTPLLTPRTPGLPNPASHQRQLLLNHARPRYRLRRSSLVRPDRATANPPSSFFSIPFQVRLSSFFFFNVGAPPEIYPLPLPDALPLS